MKIIVSASLQVPFSQLIKTIVAGADVIRYNFSHYSLEENLAYIQKAREEINKIHADVKELFDLPLNKIRLGDLGKKNIIVAENEEYLLKSAANAGPADNFIPVNTDRLGEKVTLHQIINLANGQISLQVTDIIDADSVMVKILNNGKIKSFKTFNCGHHLSDKEMLAQYDLILQKIIPLHPDYIAFSYINEAFYNQFKQLESYQAAAKQTKMVLKVEEKISNSELEMICQDTNNKKLLIDRGELAVNMPYEYSGIFQKQIFNYAKKYSKPVIVSTQILSTTVNNFIPSRPEITDLTDVALAGAYGVILCHEMSVENRPAYTVSVAKKIIQAIEEKKHELVT